MKDKTEELEKRFDPDARFLLANERTLLAWIRTSIALQAGGLVLAHFTSNAVIQRVVSIFIIGLGGWMAYTGYSRYKAADRAIRAHELPSNGSAPQMQAASVVLISVVLIIGILVGVH